LGEVFLDVLKIMMENNIFCFANSHWLQLSGTAMGTPAACAYATILYGYHENSQILPQFTPNLLYFKRYIDDIFGIWLPPITNKNSTWTSFKSKLNEWGSLTWIIEEPSPSTIFLDLNIKIENGKILTSTHQKPMNLYLYIPPPSAHPPNCFKGLIIGEMKTYWQQNNEEDFTSILSKFVVRLTERGHSLNTLLQSYKTQPQYSTKIQPPRIKRPTPTPYSSTGSIILTAYNTKRSDASITKL
jgi:hypothetical protein